MKNKNTNPHAGSSFEDFLKETEIFEEVKAAAIKQLIALQLHDEMEKKNLTHKAMAERMGTSRS